MTDDPRATYWNESYKKYWQDRVCEADTKGTSAVQQGDAKTEGDWVYEKVFDAHPFQPGSVLDVGCAWGRMFPLYLERGLTASGIDISEAMVEAARKTWAGHERVDSLEIATAETLPYSERSFDNVVCVAVFDATFQQEALSSFLRVVKPGGHIYLTGKNSRYHPDDALAMAAEKGARTKGHPNYFTDFEGMLAAARFAGCAVLANYFFERRGDFAHFNAETAQPKAFYEWFIVLTAPDPTDARLPVFHPFAFDHSQTFLTFAEETDQ